MPRQGLPADQDDHGQRDKNKNQSIHHVDLTSYKI